MLFYKMCTVNCCFLNLIIFYFSIHAIYASTDKFIDTKKRADLGGQCVTDEDCEQRTVSAASPNMSCLSGLCKCKRQFLEKGEQHTSLIEPCIETVSNEFSGKRQLNETCVPGRCECSEERQYCTNGNATERFKPAKKKGHPAKKPLKRFPRWIQKALNMFPTFALHYGILLIIFYIFTFIHVIEQGGEQALLEGMLLQFFLPVTIYFSAIVTLCEDGSPIEFYYLMMIAIPILLVLLVCMSGLYNLLAFLAYTPPTRPEPQMYDAVVDHNVREYFIFPNQPQRQPQNQPEEPPRNQPQNQPRGRGRGRGRRGRRNRRH